MPLFQTQANTGFNSFSSPFNPMNMNSGWGMNPNYLTPSFDAPYRPAWQGGNGNMNNPDPGFFRSVNNLYSPFASSQMYGNPINNNQSYFDSIGNRPVDSAMAFTQKWAVPMAAYWGAYKLSSIQTNRANDLASRWIYNANSGFRHAFTGGTDSEIRAASMAATRSQGVFSYVGDRAGQGVARGFMGTARAFTRRGVFADTVGAAATRATFAEGVGAVAGGAAGLFLPLAVAEAGMWGFDKSVAEPYIGQRRMGRDLRDNFQNVYMGAGYGNHANGMGLSFSSSQRMAGQLSSFASKDMMFNQEQITSIANLSARSGLLDDTSGGQIVDKIKAISNQVKVLMRVANEPDFRKAIEMIANLKNAGVSTAGTTDVISRLGGYAAMGGMSVQRLMQTVGAQGQYLFQANGMTPYLGQLAAGQSAASFATAYRSGLISNGLMASMGGVEGASQSSITGQVNASQTPWNQILMTNKYLLGNNNLSATDINGNLRAFGASAVRNPYGVAGAMQMYSGMMASAQLMEKGPLAVQDQLMSYAKNLPGALNKNGHLDAEAAYYLATQTGMMNGTDTMAWLQEMRALGDPASRALKVGALQGNTISQYQQWVEQNHLSGGSTLGKINYYGHKLFNGVQSAFTGPMGDFLTGMGAGTDDLQKSYQDSVYGTGSVGVTPYVTDWRTAFEKRTSSKMQLTSKPGGKVYWNDIARSLAVGDGDTSQMFGDESYAASGINILNKNSGNSDVQDLMKLVQANSASPTKNKAILAARQTAIENSLTSLASTGLLGQDFWGGDTSSKNIKALASGLMNSSTTQTKLERASVGDSMKGRLRNFLKGSASTSLVDYASAINDASIVSNARKTMSVPDMLKNPAIKGAIDRMKRSQGTDSVLDILDSADRIHHNALANGERQVTEMLGDYASADDMYKAIAANPEGTLGKEAGAKYRSIKGDSAAAQSQRKALVDAVRLQKTGIPEVDTTQLNLPSSMSDDERESLSSISKNHRAMLAQIKKAGEGGMIDFNSQMQMTSVTKLDEAVSNFGVFVQQFGQSVGSINGSGEGAAGYSAGGNRTAINPKSTSRILGPLR